MISPEATQRIIDAYQAGVSIRGIAQTFGHDRNTVRKVLRSSTEVQLRDDRCKPKITTPELIKRHEEGWRARQIADSSGALIQTIYERLAALGLQVAPRVPELPVEELLEALGQGRSVRWLADRYGVHRETIARALAAAGVGPSKAAAGVGPSKAAPVISPLKLADLCRRGLTAAEMSRATGIGKKTLRKHLAAAGMRAADKRPGRERPAYVPEEFRRAAE